MSAWDKLVFGWLDYQLVHPGDGKTKITLGPSEAQSKSGKQAAIVTLPDRFVAIDLGAPFAGAKFYYSNTGDDMDNLMFKSVTLPGRHRRLQREGPLQHRDTTGTTRT